LPHCRLSAQRQEAEVAALVLVVSPELVEAVAEVVARFAVAVVPEQVAAERALVLLPSAPVLLLLPHPHHHQARRRLCSLRQCRPLCI
jgi:hypothetical protein